MYEPDQYLYDRRQWCSYHFCPQRPPELRKNSLAAALMSGILTVLLCHYKHYLESTSLNQTSTYALYTLYKQQCRPHLNNNGKLNGIDLTVKESVL